MSTEKKDLKFAMIDKRVRSYPMADEVTKYFLVELEDGRVIHVSYRWYHKEAQYRICSSATIEEVSISDSKEKLPALPDAVEVLIRDFKEQGLTKLKREASPAGSPWVHVDA